MKVTQRTKDIMAYRKFVSNHAGWKKLSSPVEARFMGSAPLEIVETAISPDGKDVFVRVEKTRRDYTDGNLILPKHFSALNDRQRQSAVDELREMSHLMPYFMTDRRHAMAVCEAIFNGIAKETIP